MDLHELVRNHELAKRNAKGASSQGDRTTYFDLVGYYAKRIASWRKATGVPEVSWTPDKHRRTADDA